MPDAHSNFATSLVATAPSPATSGTSLVVTGAEGSRFPAGSFNATICPATADATPANAEVVRATVSTDTFTITRAQEGSSARTVVVGDRIYAGVTAKTLIDAEAGPANALNPTAISYATHDRMASVFTSVGALTSGVLKMVGIWLPTGFTVNNISFMIGTTALVLGTSPHAWVALFDSSRALLRQSTDDTAATMAASTLWTKNLSSTFVTTYTGLHYIGIMASQTGGTLPNFWATADSASTSPVGLAPILAGTSTTGLTTTAPNPAAALTVVAGKNYGGVA